MIFFSSLNQNEYEEQNFSGIFFNSAKRNLEYRIHLYMLTKSCIVLAQETGKLSLKLLNLVSLRGSSPLWQDMNS